MSTQLIGFSIGGISRRFLVDPPSMSRSCLLIREMSDSPCELLLVWPANLVTCALFNTLHSQTYAGIGDRKGMNRERFFFYCFMGSIFYCEHSLFRVQKSLIVAMSDFLPGYLFQALRCVSIPSQSAYSAQSGGAVYSPGYVIEHLRRCLIGLLIALVGLLDCSSEHCEHFLELYISISLNRNA